MAGGAVLTFAPQLTDSSTAALVLLIMGITAALSRWLIGAVADRRGARPFIAPLLSCAAAAMAVCAWAVAREQSVALIVAATALGLSYGALQNLTLIVAFAAVEPDTYRPRVPAGHWLRFRHGVRRRPRRCPRLGVLLPRRPGHAGRDLSAHRYRHRAVHSTPRASLSERLSRCVVTVSDG